MIEICEYLGMDSKEYLGEVDVSARKFATYERVVEHKNK